MQAELIVQPSISFPGQWYWCLLVDGEVYREGTSVNENLAKLLVQLAYFVWLKQTGNNH